MHNATSGIYTRDFSASFARSLAATTASLTTAGVVTAAFAAAAIGLYAAAAAADESAVDDAGGDVTVTTGTGTGTTVASTTGTTVTGATVAGAEIDLLRAVQLGLAHDESVQIARKGIDARRAQKRVARSPLLPQVSATVTGTHRENTVIDGNSDGNAENLRVTQSLWNARQRTQYEVADKNLRLAQIENDQAHVANIINVTEAYFGVLSSASRLRLARGNVEAVEAHKEVVDTLFEIHESTILDLTETEADLDLARVAVITAENDLANSRQLLLLYIAGGGDGDGDGGAGAGAGFSLMPVSPDLERLAQAADPPLAEWLQTAARANHDLRLARLRLDIAADNIRAAELAFYPTVSLSATWARSRSNAPFTLSGRGDFNREAVVAVDVPVWHGGLQQAQLHERQVAHELQQLAIARQAKRVQQRVTDLYRSRQNLHKRLFALQSLVESNRKKLDATRDGFARGDRTSNEVLEAQNLLVQSEIDLIGAIHDYIVAGLQLKQSAGALSVADIEAVNRAYFAAN